MKILWAADAQLDHGRIYLKQDINVFLLVKKSINYFISKEPLLKEGPYRTFL
jgi:hypothetical protein